MRQIKTKGEIVEVDGGRVVRSLGRKDRHSKVLTSKGPKDRRVRLSPDIAMQFYDVQDRLGYDRPSKAIDWLMKEAKTAIDALNHNRDSYEAFHRTPGERNQHVSTDSNQMGLIDPRNECPAGEDSQLDFTLDPSYDWREGFAFVDSREPLQSSCPTSIRTLNNGFVGDAGFLGFDFQQENKLEDEANCYVRS